MVPSTTTERGGKVFLVKNCTQYETTETIVSSDAKRYKEKQFLDGGFDHKACQLNCLQCNHRQPLNIVFVDITNRCNLNCPICINNTPSMGSCSSRRWSILTRFSSTFRLEPAAAIQLFGGEPTVRRTSSTSSKLRSYGLTPRW